MRLVSASKRNWTRNVAEKLDDAIMDLKSRRGQRRARRTAEGERRLAGLSARELMYRFASLGDNCEFGLVQRRCGAEPLGLFRFATIDVKDLARALEARLADIADPDWIEIIPSNGRFIAHHGKYDIKYGHTGFREEDLSPEKIRSQMLDRLRHLARKLIEILNQGEKILVCRTRNREDAAWALRVGEALRRFGPNTLLWVVSAEVADKPGSVERVAEGVLRGYIESDSDWDNLRLDTWMTLCERAHDLWKQGLPAEGSARAVGSYAYRNGASLRPTNRTEADICGWCASYLSQMLEIPLEEIGPDVRLRRLGLDSANSIELVVELEDWLGIRLTPEVVFDHPTIAELARYLAAHCGNGNAAG